MKALTEILASRGLRILLATLVLVGAFTGPSGAIAQAAPSALDAPRPKSQGSGDNFLSVDQAFRLGSLPGGADRVRLVWQIADGYYLYRGRIKIRTASQSTPIGAIQMPPGKVKNDEFLGPQEIYHHELVVDVPVRRSGAAALTLPLQVTYQGCAEAGLCYPPVTKTLNVDLPAAGAGGTTSMAAPAAGAGGGFVSEQDSFAHLAASGNLFLVLGAFFIAGLGLACTPCVLPMVSILFAIILGQKNLSTTRAFSLSLTYVLGMAFTYTVAGVLTAAAGAQVQAVFQQTWILLLFAALLVAMALAMFGLFTVQVPSGLQTRISEFSNRQSAGTFGGVALMGALSSLIATTCVAPALVGALLVIAQTGDMVRGGATLFALSIGMGTPLLVLGASQGKLLPKAGPWMETVKHLGGALLLGVAVYILSRAVNAQVAVALWAIPAAAIAWVLLKSVHGKSLGAWTGRLAGGAFGAAALVLLAGAGLGATDPLAPLAPLSAKAHELPFRTIRSVAELDQAVAQAHASGRPVLLDFYADWCTSCKEMEKYTFTDTTVQTALHGALLLRADVTRNDADDQALLKRFGIFGPPTIAFYGDDGQERATYRVVGYMKAPDFARIVRAALAPPSSTAGVPPRAAPAS